MISKNFYEGTVDPANFQYYLDFDLAWRDLAEKVENSYKNLKEMLNKAPIGEDDALTIKFYQRKPAGLELIKEKSQNILYTAFTQTEFNMNPKDPDQVQDFETKVLSMVFWMAMEPNLIPVARLPNGDIFLIMDIFNLYDKNEFPELSGDFNPPSGFEEHQEQYKIFSRSDIKSFVHFHNHLHSDSHSDIISYIMAKFKDHYVNFLEGNDKSKLVDLR